MPVVACPKCAAQLKAADDLAAGARLKCPECGARFSPGESTPAQQQVLDLDECEEEPTGRRSRVILLAASAGLALLLASVAVGWFATRQAKTDDAPSAATPPAEPQPPAKADPAPPPAPTPRKPRGDGEQLSAPALLTRYGADLKQGAMRYDGATLTVSGKMVNDAEQRAGGEVVIGLSGPRPNGERVWCRLNPKAGAAAAHLPAGADVTVRGRCLGSGLHVGAANGFRVASDVILADCALVGEPFLPKPSAPPTLPTPEGVDHPAGIEHHGIEVRVTAVYVGRPVMVLGPNGPNPGATARTGDKYLVFKMEVKNKGQGTYSYTHDASGEAWLWDERVTRFDHERLKVLAAAGTVVANELNATPTRRWRFEGEAFDGPLAERQTATYFLIFDPKHLGEGKKLYLTLPAGVFGLRVPDQVLRFDQSVVEPLPASSTPDLTPATALTIEAATTVAAAAKSAVVKAEAEAGKAEAEAVGAEAEALATQLAKGKTPADRIKAADDLRRMGKQAKGATAPLVKALFDPSTPVRVAALDALKAVNPPVYGPVATLVAPLTEADALFMGSSGRPEAVAALAKLGAEGRAAVPVLVWFKGQIARPGGWPQVPAVVDALAALAPNDPAVVALLVQGVTKDGYAAARLSAAKGLARSKASKESVAALAAAVRGDPEAEVRVAALNALAWFGEEAKAALKAVEAAKMDPDQRVREAARDAIEHIK